MLSEQDKAGMLSEVFDSKKITLRCGKHNYFGPVKDRPEFTPTLGCKECWQVFYVHELTECPPDKRREKLEEIEEVMHKVVEMVEKGTWDFVPYEHAQVQIGKE